MKNKEVFKTVLTETEVSFYLKHVSVTLLDLRKDYIQVKPLSMAHSFMGIRTIYTKKALSGKAMIAFSMIPERISSLCVP